MPTLLQLGAIRPDIQARLDAAYTVHHHARLPDPERWLAEHAAEVEAVVTGGHNGIPTALMTALPNLRIVAINGVGYDKVDLAAAKARGIRVTNTPDVLTDDVADLAVGLTITLMRRLHHAHSFVAAGHWPRKGSRPSPQGQRQAVRHPGHGAHRPGGGPPAGRLRRSDQLHGRAAKQRALPLRSEPAEAGRARRTC